MNKILIQDQRTEQRTIVDPLAAMWIFGHATWERIKARLEEGEKVVKSDVYLVSDYEKLIEERTGG